ncbi:DEAD/DEAH box helicase [Bombella apis]|uniref:DEAD/DEAH box helicase n=1 Tax=Bombella apis TaxID=1785988 RepID=UPI001D0EB0D0|nr:DEAD/DEAH box helicase [Bombella apis]
MSSKPSSGPSKTRSSTSRVRKTSTPRTKTPRTGTETGMEQPADDTVQDDTTTAARKPATRRRSTTAGTRKKATTPAATAADETAPAAEAAEPAEKPKRTTRRRSVKPTPEDAPSPDEATESSASTPAKKTVKRTRRKAATAEEASAPADPTAAAGSEEAPPARKRRATTRTRKTAETETAKADVPEKKPATPRTRRKKTAEATPATETVDGHEESATPPTRRPSTRRKAAEETVETTAGSAAPAGTEDKASATPAKPRRKRAKKAEAEMAEPQAEKPAEETPTETGSESRILFSDLGLSEPILRAVEEMGYTHPTPIQAQAVPEILTGRDVLGVAQTGTGKTASFTLPMLEKLSKSRARARMPRSLILEPTRELALQVAENFKQYGAHLRLTHALLIGGGKMNEQKELLNRGVDVLIATPGRLLDMFERGGLLMTQTDLLVIDEADRMLDMGFIPDIERIVSLLPRRRQTLFFSATMAPEIRRLADNFLNSPKEITVARQSSVASTITEGLLVVEKKDKSRALCALLRQDDVQNAIIFCNRKRDVDTLERHLTRQKFSVGHLHGDLTQDLRFETLERFRTGDLQILVCSDVAARGIDIGGLSHVFNYDLPFNAEDYVHRIGRTGRAGKEGKAYSLATPDEQKLLEAVESLTGKTIEPLAVKGFRHLEWRGEEDASPASAKDESKGQQRGGRNRKTAEPKQEDRPARKKQPERDPLPEARKHDHKRSGRAELLPPVPEKNGMQDGFGENVPAFMKVSFLPEPRDPSDS